jgi:hypothetical protein
MNQHILSSPPNQCYKRNRQDDYFLLAHPPHVSRRIHSASENPHQNDRMPFPSTAKRSRSVPQNSCYYNGTMCGEALASEEAPTVTPMRRHGGAHEAYSDSTHYNAVDWQSIQPQLFTRNCPDGSFSRDAPFSCDAPCVTPARDQYRSSMGYAGYPLDGSAHSLPLFPPNPLSLEPLSHHQEELFDIDQMLDRTYPEMWGTHDPFLFSCATHSTSSSDSYKENQSFSHPAPLNVPPPPLNESTASLCPSGPSYPVCTPVLHTSDRHGTGAVQSNMTKTTPKREEQRFKTFHEVKWNEHMEQLREFKQKFGHCLVPHTFPENQNLARWVKRQRRQYKLMEEGQPSSTMSQARAEVLNKEGFVWDSHDVVWRERYAQLVEYKHQNGHCRVPSYCKEQPQLASWVKCQRRQYKLFWDGKRSSMSVERTHLLDNAGFTWEVRPDHQQKKKNDDFKKLAEVLNGL